MDIGLATTTSDLLNSVGIGRQRSQQEHPKRRIETLPKRINSSTMCTSRWIRFPRCRGSRSRSSLSRQEKLVCPSKANSRRHLGLPRHRVLVLTRPRLYPRTSPNVVVPAPAAYGQPFPIPTGQPVVGLLPQNQQQLHSLGGLPSFPVRRCKQYRARSSDRSDITRDGTAGSHGQIFLHSHLSVAVRVMHCRRQRDGCRSA